MTKLAASPEYFRYIRSDAWLLSAARLAELASSGGRCRLCDRGAPDVAIHVHHRTYARFACERAEDLTTLCAGCHDVVTPHVRRVRKEARLARLRRRSVAESASDGVPGANSWAHS